MHIEFQDAKQELTLFLLEFVNNINLSKFQPDDSEDLYKYICVSLKNQSIGALRKHQKAQCVLVDDYDFVELSFAQPDLQENVRFGMIKYVELEEALNQLTPKQKEIIVYKYIHRFTDEEIGKMLNITRQAVCRMKNRAFENLKKYYDLE